MSMSRRALATFAAFTALAPACADDEGSTELNPAGPPMIRQVMLTERYTTPAGERLSRGVIAFGRHPDAEANEQHHVPSAAVANQRIRVVMDELLVGNYLEEIQCNAQVDEDDYSRVPLGATPDDIARCAVVAEQLARSCKGSKAVCVRASDGVPVGVRDELDAGSQPYKDGIADSTKMIEGAAGVVCTDNAASPSREIRVPLDLERSYWQPAGNQQRPVIDDGLRGLFSLGPAVVMVPAVDLPTGLPCSVFFGDEVVDKSKLRPCAPPEGDIAKDCTPGDTSQVDFTTEPMVLLEQTPQAEAVGVSRTADLLVRASATFDPAVTVTSAPAASFSVNPASGVPRQLVIRPTVPLAPGTRYVVTVPLRDAYGNGPSAPATLTFTTAAL
jgi:Bacterial Ig-like domain